MNKLDTAATGAVEEIADLLYEAARTGVAVAPVRELIGETNLDTAYAVQEINTRRALAAGRRLVGRKIGLTSVPVQKQLGVGQPDYGMLFADMARTEGEEISLKDVLQPKVEAEIAFVLGHDLDGDQLTVADLFRAIEFAVPAIEIVGSRIANWDIRIADTISDNASSGLYVLGSTPKRLGDFDSRQAGMVMERQGAPVSSGVGAACLGSPLNATLWLAKVMARAGRPLRAGDTVLSGALGPMVPVAGGDVFDVRIAGLGSVTAAFATA
ncbi:TPA: toluene degradation hydratase TodJ [Burkholderia aenigmatica]|uniref:toluene degradation hydratase TodJ n=1 Tax=Burkholderia sp. AU45251 TaxID=3059204 RepID=UPI0026531332|nr:toluene degradation hydratase TodJ [Burkholderia sp. AU45251]HDR9486443.1 toluene degradation hydratase TodJ [Burkholderia aenigmatica]MDN7519926.1 toluene degradation hydratase TodJ [Burkholderia sp. AU45251]HDR9517058.1 toluene degradation hydratase TodJ [Burkholderia aenigmatica]HDR9594863.1 toluene degradation hydratase TodJ [Burkholderia aenigmatica]HDR9600152.1 toluene degradation hydratase TodJ [Burkholderia aenigmatica]